MWARQKSFKIEGSMRMWTWEAGSLVKTSEHFIAPAWLADVGADARTQDYERTSPSLTRGSFAPEARRSLLQPVLRSESFVVGATCLCHTRRTTSRYVCAA